MNTTSKENEQMTKQLSVTQQWMKDHPNDKPCPVSPDAAAAWRRARGIGLNAAEARAKWAKYHKAMSELRTAKAEASYPQIN